MKISTKGRYAVRVMLDLAQQGTENYIPLMDIAKRQGISEKYLESIVAVLSKNDFLQSLRGKGAVINCFAARNNIRWAAF